MCKYDCPPKLEPPTSVPPSSMKGKSILITGVSRRKGIGYGIACRLASLGADICIQSYAPYDREIFKSIDTDDPHSVAEELRSFGNRVVHVHSDFNDPAAPAQLVRYVQQELGPLHGLVLNHTYDSLTKFDDLNANNIDRHLAVNVRAALLLVKAFADQYDGKPGGRIVMLTSGQHLGPMPDLAYVATKGAIHQLTHSLSDLLIDKGITVNTVNPGPTKTFTPDMETDQAVLKRMPLGRWGLPDDAARLISWLLSDDASWITGQVFNSEGGFRRG